MTRGNFNESPVMNRKDGVEHLENTQSYEFEAFVPPRYSVMLTFLSSPCRVVRKEMRRSQMYRSTPTERFPSIFEEI